MTTEHKPTSEPPVSKNPHDPELWTFERGGRRYYNKISLRRACRAFERAYGVSSEEAMRRHIAGEEIHPDLSHFDRGVWLSFWREVTG